jgi:YVTN family beta-propeller protein
VLVTNTETSRNIILFLIVILSLLSLAISSSIAGKVFSLAYGQTTNTNAAHSYTLVDGTFNISSHNQVYAALYTSIDTVNSELNGTYQEYNGQNIGVILYDGSSCSQPDSLGRVNITSCTTSIFSEVKPAGSMDLPLAQDKTYYLVFDNRNDANATVSAHFVDYYSFPVELDNKIPRRLATNASGASAQQLGSSSEPGFTVAAGKDPFAVAVNPNTNMIYLANNGSDTVSVIDGKTNSVVKNIMVGTGPSYVSVNPNTDMVYVTNFDSDTVSVIDGKTNAIIKTITVGKGLEDIAINPNTNMAYMAVQNGLTVLKLSPNANSTASSLASLSEGTLNCLVDSPQAATIVFNDTKWAINTPSNTHALSGIITNIQQGIQMPNL